MLNKQLLLWLLLRPYGESVKKRTKAMSQRTRRLMVKGTDRMWRGDNKEVDEEGETVTCHIH